MKRILIGLMMLLMIPAALASMTRDFATSTVAPGANIDVTYTATSTGFNGIEDTVPSGWTLVTSSTLISLNNNILRAAWTGSTQTITLQAPSTTGTATFSGIYESTGGESGSITGESQITIAGTSQTCSEAGGICKASACSAYDNCNPLTGTCTSGNCCTGACTTPTQTCSQLGGTCCSAGQTCSGTSTAASGCNLCCIGGTCTTPTPTCEETLGCDPWEQCNEDETKCEMASWVWMVAVFFGLMIFLKMFK